MRSSLIEEPEMFNKLQQYVTNRADSSKVTIQELLEILDGPLSIKNGEFIIMTTNYIKHIDKALFRPGRVNNMLKLRKSTLIDMRNIFEYYYGRKIDPSIFTEFSDYQFTPALISEACNVYHNSLDNCLGYLRNYKVPN